MKHTSDTSSGYIGQFGLDTAAVLFFLALEYGREVRLTSIDGLFMLITMGMVAVLPYFLPSRWEQPSFFSWMIARSSVAVLGLVCGAVFSFSLGVVIPEALRFAPMTMLIVVAMVSCYVQFYCLLKLRPAK